MRWAVIGGLAMALAACQPATPETARVAGAWVRLPAVPGRPGAAYFTILGGRAETRLVAVRTPAARRVELHQSMGGEHGAMTMRPLSGVVVPAGGKVDFAVGGRHAMLFDVDPGLKAGGSTSLELVLADGRTLMTSAPVRGAGEAIP